jgi:hypothetical protein
MPVSYPNKKPAVQTKKPKKYARRAPSLVPLRRAMMKGKIRRTAVSPRACKDLDEEEQKERRIKEMSDATSGQQKTSAYESSS